MEREEIALHTYISASSTSSNKSAGSPLGFTLLGLQYGKLASHNSRSLYVRLDQCSVSRYALALGELFDLVQNKGCVVFARRVRCVGLSQCLRNDNVHFVLRDSMFYWDGVREKQAGLYLECMLCIWKLLVADHLQLATTYVL